MSDPSKCPHTLEKRDFSKKIKDDITDCVGNTPLIRINNITKSDLLLSGIKFPSPLNVNLVF